MILFIINKKYSKTDNSSILAGCSGINELKIFDIANDYKPCASILEMKEGVYSCDYGNKGDKFAFSGGEGIVYIMSLNE